MITSLAALLLALLLAAGLTPLVRRLGHRLDLAHDPREGRSVHAVPTPGLGGVAMALAFFASLLVAAAWDDELGALLYSAEGATLLIGALAALLVGLVDELRATSPRLRLLLIAGLAAFAWAGGHQLDSVLLPGVGTLELGVLSAPATILWITGVVVAFDFIDGLDGLAAGIALIAAGALALFAGLNGELFWMTGAAALAGALVGFGLFNLHPASVFMGDSGSNFLGYVVAVLGLGASRDGEGRVALLLAVFALGLPLLDAALTMLRRALLREGLFMSERGHLHHRLLDRGLGPRRVAALCWACSAALGLAGLMAVSGHRGFPVLGGLLAGAVVLGLMFSTGYLRPADLAAMWRRGLENQARVDSLEALCAALALEAEGKPAGEERVHHVLRRLCEEGGISGVSYRHAGGSVAFGGWDPEAKGVRASFPASGGVTLQWAGRRSGPTKREVRILRTLLDALVSPA